MPPEKEQDKKRLHISPGNYKFVPVSKSPILAIVQRAALVVGLILAIAVITYAGRKGYIDQVNGDGISFLDALYYSTVSITTTGYGDIVPQSESARFINTLIITPLRVLFVILLVGTTVELLATRTKFLYKLKRWRGDLNDHVVICGFGVKGQNALEYLRESGKAEKVVAIDPNKIALDKANMEGVDGIVGDAADVENLSAAKIETAREAIVCPRDDDEAILITLRIRELCGDRITIVAACREEKNVELLKSSGANQVIVSSSSAGRLLGMAAEYPAAADLVNDLLTLGEGRDIQERDVRIDEIGETRRREETIVAIIRDGKELKLNDPELGALQAGDRIISICE